MLFPEKFIAGQTIKETLSYGDYPAGTWTLTVAVRGGSVLNATATADGTAHSLTIDTSSLTAGLYEYHVKVTNGTETYYPESGTFTVKTNIYSQEAGYTGSKTFARRMLEAVETMLEARATASTEVKKLKINGRELEKHTLAELVELRSKFYAEVQREQRQERGQNIFGPQVKVKF